MAIMAPTAYMTLGLVGLAKAARGKTPTDVWWQTIVSPNGKEKTGMTGEAAIRNGRQAVASCSKTLQGDYQSAEDVSWDGNLQHSNLPTGALDS